MTRHPGIRPNRKNHNSKRPQFSLDFNYIMLYCPTQKMSALSHQSKINSNRDFLIGFQIKWSYIKSYFRCIVGGWHQTIVTIKDK